MTEESRIPRVFISQAKYENLVSTQAKVDALVAVLGAGKPTLDREAVLRILGYEDMADDAKREEDEWWNKHQKKQEAEARAMRAEPWPQAAVTDRR